MALQASGQISLNDLRNEFGQPAGETKLSTYRKKIPSTYFFAYKDGTEARLDGQEYQTLLNQNTTYYIFVPPSDTGTWTITDSDGTAITTGITGNGATAGGVITIDTSSYSGGDVIGYVRSSECTTFNYYLEVSNKTSTGVQTSLWNENYLDIVCNPNFLSHSSTTLLQSGAYYTCPDYSTTSTYLYPGLVKNGQSISFRVDVTSGFNETPENSYVYIALATYDVVHSSGSYYSGGNYQGGLAWRNSSSYLGPSYNPNTASGIQTVLHNPNWSLHTGSGWTMSQPSSTANGTVITFTNNTGSDRWIANWSNGGKWNQPFAIQYGHNGSVITGTQSWDWETQKYGAPYKYSGNFYVAGIGSYTISLGNTVVHNDGDSGATSQANKIKELFDNSSYSYLYTTSKPNASTVRVTLKSGTWIRPTNFIPGYYYLPGTNTTLIATNLDRASNLGYTSNSYGAPSFQATGLYINNSGNIRISEFYSVQDNPTQQATWDFLIGA